MKDLTFSCIPTKMADKLRFITYLSPGIPVQLFETIMHYLEEVTGKQTYLIHESRWSGPPLDRDDPFTANEADIGFMCSPGFLRLAQEKKEVELCQAAPVYNHVRGEQKPVYFSDVITVNDDSGTKQEFKEFTDLKGFSFAFNEPMSLSGTLIVLGELKKRGYNSTFFGNTLQSGSHRNSIKMVLDRKADIAAIDSNTLHYYLQEHPEGKDKIKVLTSFGPLPVHPIVFNKRLPAELKKKITDALLDLHNKPEWMNKLREYNIFKFTAVDMSHYDMEINLLDAVKNLKIAAAYY